MHHTPKTLVVEFAPREDRSRTRSLRKHFTDLVSGFTTLTIRDLGKDAPPIHTNETLQAYEKRNYLGKNLSKKEKQLLRPFDELRDELLAHDILILSCPVYNFGMPAPMKAWIDAVMQKGYVYTVDENGHVPLLGNLKVLQIYTSGIVYDQIQENEHWNGLLAEGGKLFEYMGAEIVRRVHVQGTDMLREDFVKYRTENVAIKKLNGLAKVWYVVPHNLEIY